jgi:hypothetical protein
MLVKTLVASLAVLAVVGLGAADAFAFSCPSLQKAANESIAKAEPKAQATTGDREKARAMGMVEEAKALVKGSEADHAAGAHARSEAKAKAAKWLADQVQ